LNILDSSAVVRLIAEILHQNIQTISFIDQADITITHTTDVELTKIVRKKLYRKISEQYDVVGTVWRIILTFKDYARSRLPKPIKHINGNIIETLKKHLRERDANIYSEAINVAESINGATFLACDKHYKKPDVIEIGDKHKLDTAYINPKQKVKVIISALKS